MPDADTLTIHLLGPTDAAVLGRVADGVFDGAVDPRWSAEFLADSRHHLVVARTGGVVVGMASAVHYVHPDKPPELWINEVGVALPYRRRGIARRLLHALLAHGRRLGCREAWVLTEAGNAPARRLYTGAGGTEDAEHSIVFTFRLDAES